MKKVIAFLMIVALVMSFAACNKSNSNGIVDKNAEAPSKAGDTSKEEVESIQGNATATEVSDKNDTAKENEKGSSNEEDVTKPPHVHEYTDEVVVQTCTKDGYTKHTCNCGNSYVDTKVSAVGHKYGEWKVTKEPTTKETGAKERKCSACDVKETQTIGKLIENHTHTFTESLTKAATCSAEGVKTFTCSCGEKYTENIEKTAHKYVETVVKPSCVNGGYTIHKCTCGDSYTDTKTNATGHSYTNSVVKATCTENGYTKYTCTNCNNTYKDSTTAAIGHSYKETSDTATCTSNGVKTEICDNCGNKKTSTTKAFGHSIKTDTVNPTCVKAGYIKETCTTCNTVVSNTVVPASGNHNYTTMRMSAAVKAANEYGHCSYNKYAAFQDWNVSVCKNCYEADLDTLRFAYSDREAAEIMLAYVNDLRASVYGSHEYDLVIDNTLLNLAKTRAKEISTNYSHYGGTYTNASENIDDNTNIYSQFNDWVNSPGHYNIMIWKDKKYFGYAVYRENDPWALSVYGVQLFWTEMDRNMYFS